VVAAFTRAGLPAENPSPLTGADYGSAPRTAVEAILFGIPSLCRDCGGRVFSFATLADLQLTQKYFAAASKSGEVSSWFFVRDNILVQLNGRLAEAKAKQYEAALNAMQ
jgi:hypothetical protein